MNPTRLSLALLLALGASVAGAANPDDGETVDKNRTRYDLQVRALGGYFDGLGVRTDSGGVGILELDLTPRFKRGRWSIDVPLRLDHRQTFGAKLNETVAGAGIDLVKKDGGVRSGWLAAADYTWRPDWPDLYQPNGSGGLLPTSRYSNFQGEAGWHYWNALGDGRNARLKIRYVHTVYPRDPNYNEADSVVHLAPRDNGTLKLDASYRTVGKTFAWAVRFDGFFRQDLVVLAKNADTGGTSRSNPKQRLVNVKPSAEIEVRTKPFDLTVGLAYIAQVDTFEGYYSYTAPSPFVQLQVTPSEPLSVGLRGEVRPMTFGPNSKANTEDGKRLQDTRYGVKGDVKYRLREGLSVVAEASWTRRDTNFPDYVPGVYPSATSLYDIKWDYTNTMVTAGVEWKP